MKRLRPTDPLTADDVAERLNRAIFRALRILMEVRQDPNLFEQVKQSPYLVCGIPEELRDEMQRWVPQQPHGPRPKPAAGPPAGGSGVSRPRPPRCDFVMLDGYLCDMRPGHDVSHWHYPVPGTPEYRRSMEQEGPGVQETSPRRAPG